MFWNLLRRRGTNRISLAAAKAGLPSMDTDGTVHLTIHQVNQDGAGSVRYISPKAIYLTYSIAIDHTLARFRPAAQAMIL